jgi:hypothetical protein
MIWCTKRHTRPRWKWKLSCIVSWLLTVVAYHWFFASSKASSSSSSTSLSRSISSRCIVLGPLVILSGTIVWLRSIVLQLHSVMLLLHNVILLLHSVIILLHSVIWGWYLVKMWCNFLGHHLCMHPISICCSFPHQVHGLAIFVIMVY